MGKSTTIPRRRPGRSPTAPPDRSPLGPLRLTTLGDKDLLIGLRSPFIPLFWSARRVRGRPTVPRPGGPVRPRDVARQASGPLTRSTSSCPWEHDNFMSWCVTQFHTRLRHRPRGAPCRATHRRAHVLILASTSSPGACRPLCPSLAHRLASVGLV